MTDDLWRIADEVADLAHWEPEPEAAAEILNDPEWVRKRMLALEFTRRELATETERYAAERDRLDAREQEVTGPLADWAARLESSLAQYLAWKREDEERSGRKPSASVKLPHGTIRSGAGRVAVVIEDEDVLADWLVENRPDLVNVVRTIDRRGLVKLVAGEVEAGHLVPLMDPDTGEKIPGVRARRGDRWVKVDGPS